MYAFKNVYGYVNYYFGHGGNENPACRDKITGGCVYGHQINIYSISTNPNHSTKFFIHELGHVFENILQHFDMNYKYNRSLLLRGDYTWHQHPCSDYREDCESDAELFADMYIAWVYDMWNATDANYETIVDVNSWMNGLWKP